GGVVGGGGDPAAVAEVAAGAGVDDGGGDAAAVGRVTCFTGHRLLATGERAVVPELLPACPLTSDMLEQQREIARRLSFTVESSDGFGAQQQSNTRASRLRLSTLSADMRCFLLANPGAVFADFLRWYSPPNWSDGPEG
ncbi:unnamed protein product, partial [Ectocarpus sp. 8 AP-2014]